MQLESAEVIEAIMLFGETQITRELLYPEFEAILDGFIPVPDFNAATAKAVYVRINANLHVTAAVFFLLDFDEKGIANRRWNIPLQQLAEASGRGPNLGAGAIQLACFSQCGIELQQKNLWDPHMEPANNSFAVLKKAVKNNRLGLHFRPSGQERQDKGDISSSDSGTKLALQSQLHEYYAKELRDRLAGELKQQRLRISTLSAKHKEVVALLQKEHQQRLRAYQEKLQELENANADLELRNKNLKENFDVQASKVEGLREYFSHKLKAAQLDENAQLAELQENFSLELELKVQAATAELRERLDMREVELFYRFQNESNYKDEISRLKQEYQTLFNNSGEQLLQRLDKAGINFVVYHPGVGQIAVPKDDLSAYIDNPTAYLAKRSGIAEVLYSHWFAHYQNPVCNGLDAKGHLCGKHLVRISSPVEFHEGESDRCEQHQVISFKMATEMNS